MTRLSPRQTAFVQSYLKTLNATQAAIDAGYSAKTASAAGSRLLKNVKISAEIESVLRRRQDRLELRGDDVLREFLRIASVDVGQAYDENGRLRPLKEIPEDVRRAIAQVDTVDMGDGDGPLTLRKVKFWDKNKALESLAKHLGLLRDKVELTGADGGPVSVEIVRQVPK